MQEYQKLGLTYIALGVVLVLVCLPLLFDKIGPNNFYGVRLKKSFESRENWFLINRYGARQLILWNLVLVAAGVVILLLPPPARHSLAEGLLPLLPLPMMAAPFIQILRFVKKL